jgi:hypothetical protein
MVQDFTCVQMRVSGFSTKDEFVLVAGAKAKTVTNKLPLLTVLGLGEILRLSGNNEIVLI